VSDAGQNWDSLNYFNYFTEVEEHFQRARGSGLFLLSPLDWALIEAWKNSGVPLEAVLRGIDASFEKWRERKSKTRNVNSLAYCTQEVVSIAQRLAGAAPSTASTQSEPFCSTAELISFLRKNVASLRGDAYSKIVAGLERLLAELADNPVADLEAVEQRLTVLEEKMIAIARSRQSESESLEAHQALESQLRPYRGKMSADQLKMLRDQFLDRHLLEKAGLPRLSLFYLR
jgi:hypothetical protein